MDIGMIQGGGASSYFPKVELNKIFRDKKNTSNHIQSRLQDLASAAGIEDNKFCRFTCHAFRRLNFGNSCPLLFQKLIHSLFIRFMWVARRLSLRLVEWWVGWSSSERIEVVYTAVQVTFENPFLETLFKPTSLEREIQ
jgi:hypothetical protein